MLKGSLPFRFNAGCSTLEGSSQKTHPRGPPRSILHEEPRYFGDGHQYSLPGQITGTFILKGPQMFYEPHTLRGFTSLTTKTQPALGWRTGAEQHTAMLGSF